MKVAVTGCHGFIGGHLCERLLVDGHHVMGIDHRDRPAWSRIDAVRLELGEPGSVAAAARALSGCEAVFHLAARRPFSWELGPLLAGNILRTSHLLQAMRLAGVPRLVHASTVAVYGRAERLPIDEDTPPRPENAYQASKAQAEVLAEIVSRAGTDVTVLRTTSVFGGRERQSPMHSFLDAARRGDPIRLFAGGKVRRDHVHVADVVDANLAALMSRGDPSYRVYNVASGEAPAERDLAEVIFLVLGRRGQIELGDDPDGPDHDWIVDISRARASLGFSPRPLRERIAEFAATLLRDQAKEASP